MSMKFLVIIIFSCLYVVVIEGEALLETLYWQVKPFIFNNSEGKIDGIIPRIFEEGQYYCYQNRTENETLIAYVEGIETRKKFYDLLRSDLDYGDGRLKNVNPNTAVWGPDFSFSTARNKSFEKRRNLKSFRLMKSSEMAVIVPRYMISLPNKILRGILSCQQIILLTLVLAIMFGILIWMTERINNEEFAKPFMRGMGTGIWWSLVSMTTVGYGDVVPRSLIGRMIAMVWVFIGVMIACVMTATTTEIVTGVDDLNVYGKTVSVLENSIEAKVSSEDFRAIIKPEESYEKVLESVRKGNVFAAMINADIAAWLQEEIQDDSRKTPLRIVQKLPANLYINVLISLNISREAKNIFKCMYTQSDEVYDRSVERFRRYCHTETLYLDSFGDLFRENIVVQILLGAIVVLVVLGFIFEYFTKKSTHRKGGTIRNDNIELLEKNGNVVHECQCKNGTFKE